MSIVRQADPRSLTHTPDTYFNKELMDDKVWQFGYDVLVEKAIECPCRKVGANDNLPNCQNCGGAGWTFINPLQTKAIITSINQDTKYKPWSQELIGNVSVTLLNENGAAFMDRISIMNELSTFSEIRDIKTSGAGSKFIFTSYKIEEIEDVFIFSAAGSALVRLSPTVYSIRSANGYVVDFATGSLSGATNGSISIRYKHTTQYNILDIPHIVRSSTDKNAAGQLVKIKLQNQYIARLSHYVLRPNYDGSGIIDNSY